MTHPMIPTWLKIGKKNMWINKAYDPPFTEKSFCECKTIQELADQIKYDNWCLGQAFIYENICFINQCEGAGEYLVIRDDIAFESISGWAFTTPETLTPLVEDIQAATPDQLRRLEYDKHPRITKFTF